MTEPHDVERDDLTDQQGRPGEVGSPEGEAGFSDLDPQTATDGMPGSGTTGDSEPMGDAGGDAGA